MEDSKKENIKVWLGIVLVVAILIRVLLFFNYPAVSYSDTASYRRSANAILGGFELYDGTRTPGYPAFMALIGPDRAVYAAQLVLGLGITFTWFMIGWKASGKANFGALVALAHTLNPEQIFFEANLLTETLTTFLLSLSLLGAFMWLDNPKRQTIWMGLGIGLSAALATLTRPVFIFMPFWLALFLAFSFKNRQFHFDWKAGLFVLLPSIVLVGGWMRWIDSRYHMTGLTTMTGYHLVQHTGYYFEDVPDEYAELREVYLEYREKRIEERGSQGNTIWDAIPAMQDATGMNFYELSRSLQKISTQLIVTHPWAYLSRVARGWWFFWRAPVYWDSQGVGSPVTASILQVTIVGARVLLFGMNLLFIATSIIGLFTKKLRQIWSLTSFYWLLAGSVWATSVLSSLLDHGDNPRFLVPLQTVVVFWFIWLAYRSCGYWRGIKNRSIDK